MNSESPILIAYGKYVHSIYENELKDIDNPTFGQCYLALHKALTPDDGDFKPGSGPTGKCQPIKNFSPAD